MKKSTTKILMAALALFMALGIATGSTFAWFSMNTQVTLTGMEVTAQTNTLFVEVAGSNDSGTYSRTGTGTLDASLYPVAHESWSALADITDMDIAVADTYDNWYYRYSDDPAVYNSNLTAKAYISSMTNYVAHETFSFQVNSTSGIDTGYDVYVSSITITADAGIKVVIAGEDGYKEFSAADNGTIVFNAADIISDTVTTTAQTIDVYIYIDGNDSNVYSNNQTNLTGTVEFTLDCFTNDHV